LRKTIFVLSFIVSTLIYAQHPESSTFYEKAVYDLLNYIPKNLKNDSIHKLESPILKGSLNTIGSLKLYYGLIDVFKLSENDKKWLENRINQIATELFADGKRILIRSVGGYAGCPDKMIDTIKLNNIEITDLKFCHSSMNLNRDKNFIDKFNGKMYSLMQIEPPNKKTPTFYGKFNGYGKNNNGTKLLLLEDRTFKFWRRKGRNSDFTEGFWKNRNDTLILNSRILAKIDSLTFALSSTKWIGFKDLRFRLKNEKLIELNSGKRRLKKDD